MQHLRQAALVSLLLTTSLAISGCATQTARMELDPAHFLHDSSFPAAPAYRIESRQAVFQLDESAKGLIDQKIGTMRDPHLEGTLLSLQIIQLIQDFAYDNAANTIASRTYHSRAANCLSLTILAHAIAEHLGFDASFQIVNIPEYWERRDSHSIVARHVNLLVQAKKAHTDFSFSRPIEIDFFSPGSSRRYGAHVVSDATILAMFYNNKGVDALLAQQLDRAYAYFRAALLEDPKLEMTLSNLGLLYTLDGKPHWAEKNYREVNRRNPGDTVSAEGLAAVLRITGRHEEAETIMARLQRERDNNPYYQYVKGEEALAAGNFQHAINAFRRSIEIRPDLDQPYFGLAKTYFQLGDKDRAKGYLQMAEKRTDLESAKKRYQSKMALLTSL